MSYKNIVITLVLAVLFSCGLSLSEPLNPNSDFEATPLDPCDPNYRPVPGWNIPSGTTTRLITTDSSKYGTKCVEMEPNTTTWSAYVRGDQFPAMEGDYYAASFDYKTTPDLKLTDDRTFITITFYDEFGDSINTGIDGYWHVFKNTSSWTTLSTSWFEAPAYTAGVAIQVGAGSYGLTAGKFWVDNLQLHSCPGKYNHEDRNRDCIINFLDYAILAEDWLKSQP